MAVGLEGAHPSLVSQSAGLLVVRYGQCGVQRIAVCGNVAEEVQGIRLMASLWIRTGERQRALSEGLCFIQAAGQHRRFP